ncbi:hypothetical protein ACU686_20400 [Yinghuangia aomiensis]
MQLRAPDLSYLFSHAGHVLATELTARLAEIDVTPRGHCVLVHAQQGEFTRSSSPSTPIWTRPRWC